MEKPQSFVPTASLYREDRNPFPGAFERKHVGPAFPAWGLLLVRLAQHAVIEATEFAIVASEIEVS
jgi:hypothetical protein